jgi:hypothetical protein
MNFHLLSFPLPTRTNSVNAKYILVALWIVIGLSTWSYTQSSCCGGGPNCSCIPQSSIDGCTSSGGTWNYSNCTCTGRTSPIIIDTTGKGFQLTSAQDGVTFDIRGDGHPIQIAWTAVGSGNAFLALDRNHNGTIDSGTELFGNYTQQPSSPDPNGFLALAEFDLPANGGNDDGVIDSRDAVYQNLLLWIDENHDGISQPNELHSLPELGILSIALSYRESQRTDQFGNEFLDRAAVNPDSVSQPKDGRWAYDVFLTIFEPSTLGSFIHPLQLPPLVATEQSPKDPTKFLSHKKQP